MRDTWVTGRAGYIEPDVVAPDPGDAVPEGRVACVSKWCLDVLPTGSLCLRHDLSAFRSMNADQSARLAVAFARETARSSTARLCSACVDVLGVTGAGITIMGGDQAGPICVSGPSVAALEDLQYTIGQGPCRDAFHTGASVHAPRFDVDTSTRWPSFVSLARESGIGAVFAYPLVAAGARVGVLTLYQHIEGELSPAQHDDSIALAEVLTETVLSLQDDAPPGTLAPGLDDAVQYRAEIYQASGMTAIQLSIPAAEALLRIRAHAFANDQTVAETASDIVARRLQLPNDHQPETEV
jgi:hypothetical protein